jgi:hypothetical protein
MNTQIEKSSVEALHRTCGFPEEREHATRERGLCMTEHQVLGTDQWLWWKMEAGGISRWKLA